MFVKVAASGAVIHNTISGSKMKFYRAACAFFIAHEYPSDVSFAAQP